MCTFAGIKYNHRELYLTRSKARTRARQNACFLGAREHIHQQHQIQHDPRTQFYTFHSSSSHSRSRSNFTNEYSTMRAQLTNHPQNENTTNWSDSWFAGWSGHQKKSRTILCSFFFIQEQRQLWKKNPRQQTTQPKMVKETYAHTKTFTLKEWNTRIKNKKQPEKNSNILHHRRGCWESIR